ncbi:MAG: hypothetical protein SGI87_02840 [Flavobacteriales bacterium]|nr:hypothetical protein [Flavobacteriales bacterium]
MKVFGLAFKVAIALSIGLMIVLAIFNPSKDQFIEAAEKKWVSDHPFDGETQLTEEAKDMMRKMADNMITRKNYFIGSVFQFKMGNKNYEYLGLASWFIPLQKEDPLP